MVLPIAGIFAGMSAGMINAHMNGIAAMRERREATASYVLASQLDQALQSAHEWAAVARQQAIEIEKLKAENARLKQVAKQHFETAQALAQHERVAGGSELDR
ncbi:hypothetical protein [Sinorhizobium meliloti]|uniref:hypothetical protein n=1 Tax=Rhizobium meliloti TaxID=382 RepID=UPI00398CB227